MARKLVIRIISVSGRSIAIASFCLQSADRAVDIRRVRHKRRNKHLHGGPQAPDSLGRIAIAYGDETYDADDNAEGAEDEQRVERDVRCEGALLHPHDRPRDDDEQEVEEYVAAGLDEELGVRVHTVPRVGNDLPVQADGPTFQERDEDDGDVSDDDGGPGHLDHVGDPAKSESDPGVEE